MAIEPNAEFPKYLKLVDELREHVLSFTEPKTLWNYSQCSQDCNKDIQKFRTNAPFGIWLQEASNGFMMTLGYSKTNVAYEPGKDDSLNYVRGSAKFTDPETYDEALGIVEKHIFKAFKFVKKRTTQILAVNIDKWPVELMSSVIFPELESLAVLTRNTMLNEFVEFAQTTETRAKKLQMNDWCGSEPMSIDKEKMKQVFQTDFFKQVEDININVSCDFDDDDFLGFQNPKIILSVKNRRISDDAIRQKTAQINDSPLEHRIRIRIPKEDPHKFDLEELYPLENPDVEFLGYHYRQVGNVYLKTKGSFMITISNRFIV